MTTEIVSEVEHLKPCPFCGEHERVHVWHYAHSLDEWHASCQVCGARLGVTFLTKEAAAAAWNLRAPNPALNRWFDLQSGVVNELTEQLTIADQVTEKLFGFIETMFGLHTYSDFVAIRERVNETKVKWAHMHPPKKESE